MIATVVRFVIAAWILVTLARAGRAAWDHRELVRAVWRAWRPIHLAGVLGLFAIVAGTAGVLLTFVPFMDVGLGVLLGSETNAVFAPLETAVAATPVPTSGPDWPLILLSTAFLLPLLLVLPWLAFLEEEVFRGGIEMTTLPQELLWAVVFGLVHLVMLVPVGAALAVGVAGFAYGRVYRHAHDHDLDVPDVVRRTYRPSRRGRRALAAAEERSNRPDPSPATPTPTASGTATATGTTAGVRGSGEAHRRQVAGVFHATLWHAAFNSALVTAVWATFVVAGFVGT